MLRHRRGEPRKCPCSARRTITASLLVHPSACHAGFRIPLLFASGLSGLCVIGLVLFLKESRVHRRISSKPSRWAVLITAATSPVVSRLMLVTFLAGCAFNGIESVFGLWTQARFEWGPQEVGGAFAVTGVVAAICQIAVTGPLSKRYGEARVLTAGMALTTFCVSLQPFSVSSWMIVALLALSAFGQSIAWPNVSSLLSRNVDWEH